MQRQYHIDTVQPMTASKGITGMAVLWDACARSSISNGIMVAVVVVVAAAVVGVMEICTNALPFGQRIVYRPIEP